MLTTEERHSVPYRLTLDAIEWNEDGRLRDKRGRFEKSDAITPPECGGACYLAQMIRTSKTAESRADVKLQGK